MIESALVMKILVMCMFEIDPRFDKKECAKHMTECIQVASFNNCSEYWEPLRSSKINNKFND